MLVTVSAVVRVTGPMLTSQYDVTVLGAAALAWVAAFTLFAIVYAPILTTPRVHMKSKTAAVAASPLTRLPGGPAGQPSPGSDIWRKPVRANLWKNDKLEYAARA